MILLLDAHAVVWWLEDASTLQPAARAAIANPANAVLVSAATIWELGIKRAIGKLDMTADLPETVDRAGFTAVPITGIDAWAAAALPNHHHDPFDRMLVAQASRLDAVVVSRDPLLAAYDVQILRA